MITLDTVKLIAPREAIKDFKRGNFIRDIKLDNDAVQAEVLTYKPSVTGLRKLQIKNESEVVIEMSSKILRSRYPELLNKNTIEYALSMIDEGVELDPRIILEEGKFCRVDITTDLHLDREVPLYLSAISFFNRDARFNRYSKPDQSVVFGNRSRRVCFYWKYAEVLKDAEVLRYCSSKQFEDVMRMENRLSSFLLIRKNCGTDNFVKDVLMSKAKPNLEIFKRLRSPVPQVLLDYEPGTVKFNDVVKREGYRELLRQCNYDWRQFRRLVMEYVSGDPTYYVRIAKRVLAEMEEQAGGEKFHLIDEIESKLSA